MLDETDPVVRAIQAPFEANMGDFYRRVNDANTAYQEEIAKLEKEKAEREEELARIQAGETEESEPKRPERPSREFDYDSPLASERAEPRRWPGTPQLASGRHESTADQSDPYEDVPRRRLRATWAQPPDPEPGPEPQPWSAPPPSPRRVGRPASRDDEDYSNESWLQ